MTYIMVQNRSQSIEQWASELGYTRQGLRVMANRLGFSYQELINKILLGEKPIKKTEKVVEFNHKKQNMAEWAKELGITESALSRRFSRGWSKEKALSQNNTKEKRGLKNATTK